MVFQIGASRILEVQTKRKFPIDSQVPLGAIWKPALDYFLIHGYK